MNKYDLFLQLIKDNFSQLLSDGAFRQTTLEAYIQGKRKARSVTIIAIAAYLGKDWSLYV